MTRRPRPSWRPLLVLAACALAAGCGNGTIPSQNPDLIGSSLLAGPGAATVNGPVDGITCDLSEMLAFHIHAHLAMHVDGVPRYLPAGVGIGPPLLYSGEAVVAGQCFSWLHTHDPSGVIHVESPVQRSFTLGNFFDVWGQPLGASTLGPVGGAIVATLNGQPFVGDPTTIPLDAHNVIQLDVRSPSVSFQPYSWPSGL